MITLNKEIIENNYLNAGLNYDINKDICMWAWRLQRDRACELEQRHWIHDRSI